LRNRSQNKIACRFLQIEEFKSYSQDAGELAEPERGVHAASTCEFSATLKCSKAANVARLEAA